MFAFLSFRLLRHNFELNPNLFRLRQQMCNMFRLFHEMFDLFLFLGNFPIKLLYLVPLFTFLIHDLRSDFLPTMRHKLSHLFNYLHKLSNLQFRILPEQLGDLFGL